MKRATRDPI